MKQEMLEGGQTAVVSLYRGLCYGGKRRNAGPELNGMETRPIPGLVTPPRDIPSLISQSGVALQQGKGEECRNQIKKIEARWLTDVDAKRKQVSLPHQLWVRFLNAKAVELDLNDAAAARATINQSLALDKDNAYTHYLAAKICERHDERTGAEDHRQWSSNLGMCIGDRR